MDEMNGVALGAEVTTLGPKVQRHECITAQGCGICRAGSGLYSKERALGGRIFPFFKPLSS